MSVPIVVFYHCVFHIDGNLLPASMPIVRDQMAALKESGLEDAASEIHIGVNDSELITNLFPKKANVVYHGTKCRTELRTLLMVEEWCRSRAGEAHCLYFHAKGSSHAIGTEYANFAAKWRKRMMGTCVEQWRLCVKLLERYEAVGAHWLEQQGSDKSQFFFAGNFYWVRASFFRTLPSIVTRDRIKLSGIDSPESRYESEVVLSIGKRLPTIKNLYSGPIGT